MGLREGDPLRDQFDAAITAMKEDGSLNDLLRKWFGEDTQVYE
jgi:polar amino acid transport system substrate-binding protein